MTLQEYLLKQRIARGETRTQTALRIGMNADFYNSIEYGRNMPGIPTVNKFISAYPDDAALIRKLWLEAKSVPKVDRLVMREKHRQLIKELVGRKSVNIKVPGRKFEKLQMIKSKYGFASMTAIINHALSFTFEEYKH